MVFARAPSLYELELEDAHVPTFWLLLYVLIAQIYTGQLYTGALRVV